MLFRLFVCLCCFVATRGVAQDPTDIFYHTVDMDSVKHLQLSPYTGDSVVISPWAGSHLLIETTILLHNGKQNMLNFFKDQQRWSFEEVLQGDQLLLRAKDLERRGVKSNKGSVLEEVTVVIYLPDVFEPAGDRSWRRKEE